LGKIRSIDYFATKANNLVRAVVFEWEETDFLNISLEKLAKEKFKKKLNFLEDWIMQKAGKAIESNSKENYTEKVWMTSNGLKIELENMKNFNKIRLIIYESTMEI
jgi:hypothetical protein